MYADYLLKLLRTKNRITQETASERLGITQQAFSKRERCENISKTAMQKTLIALNCTLEEFETLRNMLFSKKGEV